MAVDAALLVRASGSALLAVAGVVALALARGDRGAIALGVTVTAWGLQLAGNNLFSGDAAAAAVWAPIVAVLIALRVAGLVGLLLYWPRPLRTSERGAARAAGVVGLVFFALVLPSVAFEPDGWASVSAGFSVPIEDANAKAIYVIDVAKNAVWSALAVVLPLRYLATAPAEGALRRTLAWGSVLLFSATGLGADLVNEGRILGWPTFRSAPLVAFQGLAVLLWLVATRHADGRPARVAAHAILALALAGLSVEAWASLSFANAFYGVQRSVFAFLLVYAMMRIGFLGREVQVRTARRGTVAASALAVLFIVAQVAQNYLSAEYGLLTGGIVAGALLFAAQPIQRGFERLTEPATAPAGVDQREAAYRAAARRYLRDGKLSREEERELAHLAGELGLHAGRAMEMRHEAEDERARRE